MLSMLKASGLCYLDRTVIQTSILVLYKQVCRAYHRNFERGMIWCPAKILLILRTLLDRQILIRIGN